MSVTISGTNGISKVQDGVIESADFAAGVPSASDLPAGTVLQVVSATYSTETSSSSSSWADTGLTATITPTASSSKIMIFATFSEVYKTNSNGNNSVGLKLLKNGSDLIPMTNATLYTGSATNNQGSAAFSYLDSPASTSALTYKVQFRNLVTASAVLVQSNGMPSTLTLMEIAV